jgi:uncharacterized membrane protein
MQSKFLFFFIFFSFTFLAFANDPLTLDEGNVKNEFRKLYKIEKIVNQKNGITESQLLALDSTIFSDVNISKSSSPTTLAGGGELPANIPAFWWGCCLSWVGVLLVYFITDKDQSQTRKALYGCIAVYGTIGVFYAIVIILGLTGQSTY